MEQSMLKMDQKVHFYFPHSIDLVYYLVKEAIEDAEIVELEGRTLVRMKKEIVIYKLDD